MATALPKDNPIFSPLKLSINTFVGDKGFLAQRERLFKGGYSNRGFENALFEAMMRSVGWKDKEEWCAYFVKLVYMQMFSFDRDFIKKNFGGGSNRNLRDIDRLNKKGDKTYIAVYTDTPEVGDIFVLEKGKTFKGHTGIVVEVYDTESDGSVNVKTLEGNTSAGKNYGERDGQGVYNLKRNLKIGKLSGSGKNAKFMRGYIRRNFTPIQMLSLYYNKDLQTFEIKPELIAQFFALQIAQAPLF